jgi:hypothetical protein
MSTDRKIRASQQNGAQSHGPVTPDGLGKSSANSARHHLLSKTILLENERPDAFAELLAGLTLEFNPQTETQHALVETMAVSRWRQMRVWALERATLQSAMDATITDESEPAIRAAVAFRSLADDSRTLDLLHRYETRFDRQFARSLNLVMKLAAPDNPLRRTGLPACGTPVPHPGPSAEGAPLPSQDDFCQTNLIPKPDSDSTDAAGSPQDENPQLPASPLTPPAPPEPQPAATLAHFPTFVIDDAPTSLPMAQPSAPPPSSRTASVASIRGFPPVE